MKRYKWITLFLLTTGTINADLTRTDQLELEETDFHVILDPLHKAILSAQISSPVSKIFKKLGDSFDQGDLILKLDDSIYDAAFQKAKAVLDRARSVYEAKKELFEAKIASLSEFKEAYALYATAQSEFELAKKQLSACYLVAPYRGKVANVNLFEHELPQVGQPLAEIVGDEVLLAKMLVDAKYLNQLEIGRPLTIHVKELNQALPARIKRVGSVIDPASSTITVEAEIDNIDRQLMAGMTGTTSFSEIIPPDPTPVASKASIEPIIYSGSLPDALALKAALHKNESQNTKLQAGELQYAGKITYRLGKKTSLPDSNPPIVFAGLVREELKPKFNRSESYFKEPIHHTGNPDITDKLGSLPTTFPKEPLFLESQLVDALNEKSQLPTPPQSVIINQESPLNSALDRKSKISLDQTESWLTTESSFSNSFENKTSLPVSLQAFAIDQRIPLNSDLDTKSKISLDQTDSWLTTESSLSNSFENKTSLPKPIMPFAYSYESAFSEALEGKANLAKKIEYKPLSLETSLRDVSEKSSLPASVSRLVYSSTIERDLDEKSKIPTKQPLVQLSQESSLREAFDQKTKLPQFIPPSILSYQGQIKETIHEKTALLKKIKTVFFARNSDLLENLSPFFAYKEAKKISSISYQGDLADIGENSGEIALIDYPLAPIVEDFSKKPAFKKLSTKSPIREHLIFQEWEESIGSSESSGKELE